MNKKFFAALTSAAMLLSSTGVVLAADFDEVTTEAGTVGGVTVPDTEAKITEKNFPGLFETLTTGPNAVKEGSKASDYKGPLTINNDVDDITGLNLLTGLTSLTFTGNKTIADLDLTANTALTTLNITNNTALTTVELPDAEDLTLVTITGNTALTSLDLTPVENLATAVVSNNDLAELNIAGLPYLTSVDASGNKLYKVDASTDAALKTLTVNNNKIYELDLPKGLTTLKAAGNKLQSFDGTGLKKLTGLNLSNNMLESVTLPSDANFTTGGLFLNGNHLATLNLKGITYAHGDANINVNDQTLYYNDGDAAVNVKAYDSAFDTKKNTVTKTTGGSFDDEGEGVFTFEGTDTPSYTISGNGVGTMTVTFVPAQLMNRLYNPNSGEHFYTKDVNEKDTLVSLGWQDEGIGWVAPTSSDKPVYRLYNPNAGDHHYTTSANEKDTLVRVGWNYEGIGWYSAQNLNATNTAVTWTPAVANTVEVFREYNPNAKAAGAHNYTINEVENHALVSLGWIDEGIAWWALK